MTNVRSVVLFSIDGLRPDALPLTTTPHIDSLMMRGASTMTAQTDMPSITLPCHASMLLGVPSTRHGVVTNTWAPGASAIPSLFDRAHGAGLPTAAFYTWEELRDLARPGSLEETYYRRQDRDGKNTLHVAQVAAAYVAAACPALTFLYLEAPDTLGHRFGWMSEPYLEAVRRCDEAIGLVLAALRGSGELDHTAVLVTADHGGHERSHGTDQPADMTIPWVIAGPGIPQAHRIGTPVRVIDTAPTLARLLGLYTPDEWEGQAIAEVM